MSSGVGNVCLSACSPSATDDRPADLASELSRGSRTSYNYYLIAPAPPITRRTKGTWLSRAILQMTSEMS